MATYRELKQLIETGRVKTFDEWFRHIDQEQFSTATGMSDTRLKALRMHPDFILGEIMQISSLLDVDPHTLASLFIKDYMVRQQ